MGLLYRFSHAGRRTARRLYVHGLSQTVPVTKLTSGDDGRSAWYAYVAHGESFEGSTVLTEVESNRVQAGDRTHIFFDPKDPKTHVSLFATALDSDSLPSVGVSRSPE